LRGATLYTSGEPCVMCMGAIVFCGLGRCLPPRCRRSAP
jgi:guanine deaminase